MISKIVFVILVVTISSPILSETKKIDSTKFPEKTIKDFKNHFFYELTLSMDEDVPSKTSSCAKIGDSEIKRFTSYKCKKTDETTEIFWDWSCSNDSDSKTSVSIVIGTIEKCQKAIENFRARF